jgi:hypothetical protein
MRFLLRIENDPEKIRLLLKDILNRPEFGNLKPNPFRQLMQQAIEALKNLRVVRILIGLLKDFLSYFTGIFENPVAGIISSGVILVLVGILLFLVINNIRNRINMHITTPQADPGDHHSVDPVLREKEAEEYAKNGNFIEAIRHLYISLLLFLNIKGVLEFSHSRTNRETERLLVKLGITSFRDNFSSMNLIFEEKVYALKPCTKDEFESFRTLYFQCKKGALSID